MKLRVRLVLEERAPWERGGSGLAIALGLLLGFALAVALGLLTPAGPRGVLDALIDVYSSPTHLLTALQYSPPIVLSALGLCLAYRAGFVTIGSEGQVLLGAAVTVWALAYALAEAPRAAALAAAAALACAVGCAWGLVPGLLRVLAGANETLTSLMLNYAALSVVNYLVSGPLAYGPFTKTRTVPESFWTSPLEAAAVMVSAVLVTEFLLRATRLGIAVEALGSAPKAAKTYGVGVRSTLLAVSAYQGALAGLGGFMMATGFYHSLMSLNQPPGYGYMGILVAWLCGLNPTACLAGGMFYSTLVVAVGLLQLEGVPASAVLGMQALILLSAVTLTALSRYRVRVMT